MASTACYRCAAFSPANPDDKTWHGWEGITGLLDTEFKTGVCIVQTTGKEVWLLGMGVKLH